MSRFIGLKYLINFKINKIFKFYNNLKICLDINGLCKLLINGYFHQGINFILIIKCGINGLPYGNNKLEKILYIKNIILNLPNTKLSQKPFPYRINDILKIYWQLLPKNYTHCFSGYAVGINDNEIRHWKGRWNFKNKTFQLKMFIKPNEFHEKNQCLIFNTNTEDINKIDIEYSMNHWKSEGIYRILKYRYLTMEKKEYFYLDENNLSFITIILQQNYKIFQEYFNHLKFEYKGAINNYYIWQYNHKNYYIYVITKNKKFKYFVVYRKNFSHHFIMFEF